MVKVVFITKMQRDIVLILFILLVFLDFFRELIIFFVVYKFFFSFCILVIYGEKSKYFQKKN